MVMLDDRARMAAQAVHDSVAEYTPAAAFPTVVQRRRWSQVAQGALAFAAVVLFLAIGALLRPGPDPSVAEETPATVVEETPDIIDETPNPEVLPDLETPFDPTEPDPDVPVPDLPAPVVPRDELPAEPEPPVTEAPDTTPPPIAILTPGDGQRFDVASIWFEGTTEPGAAVAAGRWQADVDERGNWAIKLVLTEGANRATFIATDAAGNQATASVVVYYGPPPPPKDDRGGDEPAEWVFSAHQVYGSCAEVPPFDVFWGTAEPGTVVTISSEFGSGATEVNADGAWEVKVFFEEAPIGKVFAVKVKDVHGNKKTFEFVHTEA